LQIAATVDDEVNAGRLGNGNLAIDMTLRVPDLADAQIAERADIALRIITLIHMRVDAEGVQEAVGADGAGVARMGRDGGTGTDRQAGTQGHKQQGRGPCEQL
jgi:hypothetical protein